MPFASKSLLIAVAAMGAALGIASCRSGTRAKDQDRPDAALPRIPTLPTVDNDEHSLGGMVAGYDGTAVPGARVELGGPGLPAPRLATTDQRGTFLFRGLGPGKFVVRASTATQASSATPLLVDAATGWLPPVRLLLGPGALVKGRVVDEAGRSVAGADVEILAAPSDDAPLAGRTDQFGAFVLGPVPPGAYQLFARAPGFALPLAGQSTELRLKVEGGSPVELHLFRSAEVRGRVVDPHGGPVPGALVTLTGIGGDDEFAVLPRALPLAAEAALSPPNASTRQALVRTATTDQTGQFVLPDLPSVRSRLEVTHQTRLPLRRALPPLAPGERKQLGDLALTGVTNQPPARTDGRGNVSR